MRSLFDQAFRLTTGSEGYIIRCKKQRGMRLIHFNLIWGNSGLMIIS